MSRSAGVRMSQSLIWGLVALGIMVVFVRRRFVAIALVTAQAALIGVGALTLADDRPREFARGGDGARCSEPRCWAGCCSSACAAPGNRGRSTRAARRCTA